LPGSTVNYQVKVASQSGLLLNDPVMGQAAIRLADAARVLEVLQAYQPMPDAISDYAGLWSKVFARPAPAQPAPPPAAIDPALCGLPPAQQKLVRMLQDQPMTQQELRTAAKLARRTVYNALKVLEAEGFVTSNVDLRDTRRRVYRAKDGSGQEVTQPNE
jgi:hypothetical protein